MIATAVCVVATTGCVGVVVTTACVVVTAIGVVVSMVGLVAATAGVVAGAQKRITTQPEHEIMSAKERDKSCSNAESETTRADDNQ